VSYRNKTYVIFDGDKDMWAYRYMKGWRALDTVDFNFYDAHDLNSPLTDRASEHTIKRRLRERLGSARQVIVVIGENTKNLYRFVRWELDLALELDLPIIAVNLNGKRRYDSKRCPPILRHEYVVHVSFKRAIMKYALDHFPAERARRATATDGPRYYLDKVYQEVGILPVPPAFSPPVRLTPPPLHPTPPLPGPHTLTPPLPNGSTLANLISLGVPSPSAPPAVTPGGSSRNLLDLFKEISTPLQPWKK